MKKRLLAALVLFVAPTAIVLGDSIVHGRWWLAAATAVAAGTAVVFAIWLATHSIESYQYGWFDCHNSMWKSVEEAGAGAAVPLVGQRILMHTQAQAWGIHKCDDDIECRFTASVRAAARKRADSK